jgi:hypothetical protein
VRSGDVPHVELLDAVACDALADAILRSLMEEKVELTLAAQAKVIAAIAGTSPALGCRHS